MPYPTRFRVPVLLAALLAAAVAPADASWQDVREVWNGVFERAEERGLEWEANAFLADVVATRPPGRALDIGMGQGRNALFLAERGWRVTGFDISDEAVGQAREAAGEAGLELDAQLGDVATFDYGRERWDLVVAMYMHGLILPRAGEIVDSLAPGGLLVVEGFHRDLGAESVQGGLFGYRTNELLRAFDTLRIVYYEDRDDSADWMRGRPGAKPIVRLVARKPATGLRGAWLGQRLPGREPELFAPGLVNTDAIEINGVFTPDHGEFLFSRQVGEEFALFRSVRVDGEWSLPSPLNLYEDGAPDLAVDMSVSADGQRMYFLGRHRSEAFPDQPGADLWVSTREGDGWSTARLVPPPVSTAASESYPCVVADGSLYFSSDRPGGLGGTDVYRAQLLPDGRFAEPVNLGAPVNTPGREGDTYVAPDESYLVVSSTRPGGLGQGDLYVAFRQPDGTWGEPVHMGAGINSEHTDFCPMASPDGSVLFFSRRRSDPPDSGWDGAREGEVLWVDASVLESLRR